MSPVYPVLYCGYTLRFCLCKKIHANVIEMIKLQHMMYVTASSVTVSNYLRKWGAKNTTWVIWCNELNRQCLHIYTHTACRVQLCTVVLLYKLDLEEYLLLFIHVTSWNLIFMFVASNPTQTYMHHSLGPKASVWMLANFYKGSLFVFWRWHPIHLLKSGCHCH